jgi:hypothetical protein
MKLIYKTPAQMRILIDKENVWKVSAMIYPDYSEARGEVIYHYWTDTQYIIYDYHGREINEIGLFESNNQINPYGKIPFVFIRLGEGESFINGGALDLIYSQLRRNHVKYGADVIAKKCSFPIPLGININTNTISPDIILGNNIRYNQEDLTPSFEWIAPVDNYMQLMEYHDALLQTEYDKLGIPINDGANESGIARIIARQRLIEQRRRDLQSLANFENDFAEMVNHVAFIHNIIPAVTIDFNIEYADERIYIDPQIEREQDWALVENGALDVYEYYKKWGNFDSQLSDDKFNKLLEKRMENLLKVKEILKQKPEPEINNNETEIENIEEDLDNEIDNIEDENNV